MGYLAWFYVLLGLTVYSETLHFKWPVRQGVNNTRQYLDNEIDSP